MTLKTEASTDMWVSQIRDLNEQVETLTNLNEEILVTARQAGRALTNEERNTFDANVANALSAQADVRRLEQQIEMAKSLHEPAASRAVSGDYTDQADVEPPRTPVAPRVSRQAPAAQVQPQPLSAVRPAYGESAREQMGRGSKDAFYYENKGAFFADVANFKRSGMLTPQLQTAYRMALNEGVGEEGAFLVPPAFANEIYKIMLDDTNLLSRTRIVRDDSNLITIPVSQAVPYARTAGSTNAYWEAELESGTYTQPKFRKIELRSKKLVALVKASDEIVRSASLLNDFIPQQAADAINERINEGVLYGNGAGQMLGVVNSGALYAVDKESMQAADTVNAENVVKMAARVPGNYRPIWIAHPSLREQLMFMKFNVSGGTNQPLYVPANSLANAPHDTLLGHPIVYHPVAEAAGNLGDILLVDLSHYYTFMRRSSTLRADTSIHVFFDSDAIAFRFIMHIDGQPALNAPFSAGRSTWNQSAFVGLAERG